MAKKTTIPKTIFFNHPLDAENFDIKAADEGAGEKLPTFTMKAHNFEPVNQFFGRVIIDRAGLKFGATTPILWGHDGNQPIAHSTQTRLESGVLTASGPVSGYNVVQKANEFVGMAKNGFPWESSVGVNATIRPERIGAGEETEVNGKKYPGPMFVYRESRLLEISVIVRGADSNTNTTVAASDGYQFENQKVENKKEFAMNPEFKKWLEARNIVAEEQSEDGLKALELAFSSAPEPPVQASQPVTPSQPAPALTAESAPVALLEAVNGLRSEVMDMKKESRSAQIRAMCGEYTDVAKLSIANQWGDELILAKIENAKFKAGNSFNVNTGKGALALSGDIIEASILLNSRSQAGRYPEEKLLAQYGAKVLEAAHDAKIMSFRQLFGHVAASQGKYLDMRQSTPDIVRAAFSTLDISGILSNTANKQLLDAYQGVENAWESVGSKSNVNDFKTHTRYRLTDSMTYEVVGPDGEIPHGELDEQSFSQRIQTYAKMFSITRQDLVNDDLNAISDMSRRLGAGAARALNKVFWTLFLGLEASGYFASGNGNLDAGANALSIDGLTAGELLFLNQTMPVADQEDGAAHPLNYEPRKLIVPNALLGTAQALMAAVKLNETTTANTPQPDVNIHANKFEIVRSSYLNISGISGGSASEWYLAADPNVISGVDVAFLNGQRTPIVESADADFNTLGIQFRGYHDFGVAEQDPRAMVKMNA